jgi:hypothetical protein
MLAVVVEPLQALLVLVVLVVVALEQMELITPLQELLIQAQVAVVLEILPTQQMFLVVKAAQALSLFGMRRRKGNLNAN